MAKSRLRDLDVTELSFVDRAAVRDADDSRIPMRFLLWKSEDCGCPDGIEKAELSTDSRNALPDSAFADPKNRAYPIRKKDGSWDLAHIRNAKARCADPKNSCTPQVRARIEAAAKAAGVGDVSKEEVSRVDLQEALAVIARAGGNTQVNKNEDDAPSPSSGGRVVTELLKDASMPDDVRTYLESVETRLTALSKSEGTEGGLDDSGLVQILKDQGILPAVREMISKEQERSRELAEENRRLKLEKAEDAVRVDLAKAEEFVGGLSYLGITDTARSQVAKALFVLRREDESAAGELEKVLKANNTRMQTSALWSELGMAGQTGSGFGSARAELQSRAVELRKTEKEGSIDQIRAKILEEDPDLARRLDEEGIEAPSQ